MIKLVVGLGNPGSNYDKTRHNVGFMVIDKLVEIFNVNLNLTKFNGLYVKDEINKMPFIISKPLTFMNLSGEFVKQICNFYHISNENILIIYDEIAFDVGKIKLQINGSSNGHNGMQNIIDHFHTNKIKRIRVGIGSNKNINKADYVLSKFKFNELISLDTAIINATLAAHDFINGKDFTLLMNKYNGK